jgi:predicted nucleic acid-binding Zn ribbon protein
LGIARTCVFCGGASPLDAASCVRCREAFAGAEQRKQQRDEAARNKRYMDLAGVGIQTAGVVISSGAAEGFLDAVSSLINTLSDND